MFARAPLTIVLALVGCAGNVGGSAATIEVRGRVVDAESCASAAGCTGVAGAVVTLRADPDVRSAPTSSEGAFVLSGVPIGYRQDLVVTASDGAAYAPTSNPMVITPEDDADRFGVTLYAMPRDSSSLLEALRAQGIDLVLGGGYVGQVVRVEGSMVTAAEGAHVVVYPSQRSLRFVGVLPRFIPDEPVLLASDATATGAFGMFVVEADGPTDLVAFAAYDDAIEYDLVVAPLEPGIVTYAIHRGSP